MHMQSTMVDYTHTEKKYIIIEIHLFILFLWELQLNKIYEFKYGNFLNFGI